MLAEDSVLLREGLTRLLEEAGFSVIGSFSDAVALLSALGDVQPDAVILDVRMPPTFTDEGIRAAQDIRSSFPGVAILILSQYVESLYAHELFSSGEGHLGYLLKDRVLSLDSLRDSLNRILAGHTVLDPEVVSVLLNARRNPLATLTPRELDVLELMARGRTNAEIAEEGFVSQGTIEKQISSIFGKLGLESAVGGHRRVLAVLTWLRTAEPAS